MALEIHEALSGITGSMSLAAWVFVFLPQLYENYKLSSAEGLSLVFVLIWCVGDITNLVGSVWAGLVPTVVAIAVYFCFADAVLLAQCLYYNYVYSKKEAKPSTGDEVAPAEDEPLLRRRRTSTSSNIGLPGSRRRSSAAHAGLSSPGLPTIIEEPGSLKVWLTNAAAIASVCTIGGLAWLAAWKTGAWQPSFDDDAGEAPRVVGAEILGYISAIAYLGARLPQILKNYQEKSCEGLSLLFFMLSVLGNTTYGASILLHSVEKQYVLKNLPWLIGSFGTILEDFTIFVQFRLYNKQKNSSALED